jgi:peroxiredoxin
MAYGACDSPDAEYARRISYVISPEGKIEHVYGHVDPPKHPAEVLEDLKRGGAKQAHESSGG